MYAHSGTVLLPPMGRSTQGNQGGLAKHCLKSARQYLFCTSRMTPPTIWLYLISGSTPSISSLRTNMPMSLTALSQRPTPPNFGAFVKMERMTTMRVAINGKHPDSTEFDKTQNAGPQLIQSKSLRNNGSQQLSTRGGNLVQNHGRRRFNLSPRPTFSRAWIALQVFFYSALVDFETARSSESSTQRSESDAWDVCPPNSSFRAR